MRVLNFSAQARGSSLNGSIVFLFFYFVLQYSIEKQYWTTPGIVNITGI